MSGKIVRTTNITQSAVGNKDGLWTTVFAAAVFINDDSASPDPAKSASGDVKAPLQEQILNQSMQGQLKNAGVNDKPGIGSDRLAKSAMVRFSPSNRKSLS
jgi:hypothetical protein